MARRADWDENDDFEVLCPTSPIKMHRTFEFVDDDDDFEVIPSNNSKPPTLINTQPIQIQAPIFPPPVPVFIDPPAAIEKPVLAAPILSTKIEKPSAPAATPHPIETVSPPTQTTISLANTNCLPLRYGSAAIIPHDKGFDLNSILHTKPILPPIDTNNDVLSLLRDEKSSQKRPSIDNSLTDLLVDHNRERISLVQLAKRQQEDFLNAVIFN